MLRSIDEPEGSDRSMSAGGGYGWVAKIDSVAKISVSYSILG
jgi:hypothetical protein